MEDIAVTYFNAAQHTTVAGGTVRPRGTILVSSNQSYVQSDRLAKTLAYNFEYYYPTFSLLITIQECQQTGSHTLLPAWEWSPWTWKKGCWRSIEGFTFDSVKQFGRGYSYWQSLLPWFGEGVLAIGDIQSEQDELSDTQELCYTSCICKAGKIIPYKSVMIQILLCTCFT